ncbi:HAD family hydrolase [Allosphingosinicella sp.]|uniref:HAD family hydrolase n=1 Tax=Allosphingosinicella sp. TaxID=2823234 RepID=UPI002EEA2100
MTRAVLFDVDGTLVDSNDLHTAAWQQAFCHFGINLPYARIRAQIGKGGDNLIPTLVPREVADRLQKEIEAFRSDLFRRAYLEKAQPFPGVCELLRLLRDDGRKIVLATSAKQAELDFHLERIGCSDLVDATTSKDDVEHSKPSPDIFEAALAKVAPLGAGETLVVGDTPWDVKAAARIGVRTVAVRCGGFADRELEQAGAAAIYDGPKELIQRYPQWLAA